MARSGGCRRAAAALAGGSGVSGGGPPPACATEGGRGALHQAAPVPPRAALGATNNGAERMGRAFRHQQAPHATLRTATALEDDMKVASFRRKEEGGAA